MAQALNEDVARLCLEFAGEDETFFDISAAPAVAVRLASKSYQQLVHSFWLEVAQKLAMDEVIRQAAAGRRDAELQ